MGGLGGADPHRARRATVRLTTCKWVSATTGYGKIQIDKNIVEKAAALSAARLCRRHRHPRQLGHHLPAAAGRDPLPRDGRAGHGRASSKAGARRRSQFFVVTGDRSLVETRAALALADPLQRALGRPNREQVVTERQTAATTLQALELTNGQTLAARLRDGAARWTRHRRRTPRADWSTPSTAGPGAPADAPPSAGRRWQEIGSPVRQDGVEDLLWALVMLPEFQCES